jgi:VWFA-related protein
MGSSRPIHAALYLATALTGLSARADDAVPSKPLEPGLTEGVETRLVQFEVRVTRKGTPVSGLSAADFDIELGGKPLKAFAVDDLCVGPSVSTTEAPAARPGSFIFYFDSAELTVEGRLRAVEVARLVAPALMARGHDVRILTNGGGVRADTSWTHDAAEVSAALDRIAADPGVGDFSHVDVAEQHAEEVLERGRRAVRGWETTLQSADRAAGYSDRRPTQEKTGAKVGIDAAITGLLGELGTLAQDELRRVERDLARLSGAVRSLAARESPKGIVYFADALRRDPGAAAGDALNSVAKYHEREQGPAWQTALTAWNADAALQSLIRNASTYGVRFYAVEGRGLSAPSDWVRSSQDTIASMALETGGLAFMNGVAPSRIAASVAADQSCWYLVSFNPSGWETDRPLGLGVWMKKPGLTVLTRSSLVIPSIATLTEARLVAAHFGDPALQSRPLSLYVYPIGGTAKDLQVLAQVRLPRGDEPTARETNWDIAFDVVSGGASVSHKSSRVKWRGNGEPPVYQSRLTLPDGPYEIIAVAHEAATDSIREGRVSGTWPPSSAGSVKLSLPALAQPQHGGIVQDGQVLATGIVLRGEGNPVDPRVALAIVTAACFERRSTSTLHAERQLVGETEVSFPTMTLSPDDDQCLQIRDLVTAGSLGAGRLTYVVRIVSGDAVIASQELTFDVADVRAPTAEVIAPRAK